MNPSSQTSSKLPAELRGALELSRGEMDKLYGKVRGLIRTVEEDSQLWKELHSVQNDLLVLIAGQNKSIEVVKVCAAMGLVQPLEVPAETLELHPMNLGRDGRMLAANDRF